MSIRPFDRPLPLLLALAAGAMPAGGAAQQPAQEDPGWDPVIIGAPASMGEDAFAEAVTAELPEELFSRETNFTTHEAYRQDADYRLVMVFHGEGDGPAPETLCTVEDGEAEEVATSRPQLGNIMQTTEVTAAFCEDDQTLSTATDKITGQAEPGQLSFGFLVADVAKQLFPDGFDVIPRPESSAAPVTQ